MKYKHFTRDERVELGTLLKQKYSLRYIAYLLGKDVSSVSREISRNKDPVSGVYDYSYANRIATTKRRIALKLRSKIIIGSKLEEYIFEKLKLDWSPEQISGRLAVQRDDLNLPIVCYQTIYDHVYLNRPDWKKYLRIINIKGKYRRQYGTKIREKIRQDKAKKRIDTRPEIIEFRTRLGDWEGDTVVGDEKTIHILTHVDRKSGYLLADKAEKITKEAIQELTIETFKKLPKTKVKSITYDNGVQFEKHQDTEHKLRSITENENFNIYFAYPYHSWERGTNENTNGLLRQYYPKKTSFKGITKKELDKVVNLINNRPRKRLNYLTPSEVFKNTGVALRG